MGLDMYLYKANKISEEDRKSLTGILRSNIEQNSKFEDLFCISKSEAFFDGEKIKSGLDAIINFCDEITMKDTFINYEQFLKEYDLPTHYSLLDYGIKGDEEKKEFVFIYLDTISNCNKEVTIPYDEFNEKYGEGYSYPIRPYAENLIHGASRIEPVQIILDYLINFDIWEISGEETYIGRECVVITGRYTDNEIWSYNDYLIGGGFTLYIDKETGWLLKSADYDPYGSPVRWMITTKIAFDDEAADVRYIDLSGYEEVKFY